MVFSFSPLYGGCCFDGSGAMYEAYSCFSAPAKTIQLSQQYGSRYDE